MFGIRRRWPALAAAGAALLYVVNNYQLAGLEHLHLKPLEQASRTSTTQSFDPSGGSALGFDFTQFGIRNSPPLGNDFNIDPYSANNGSSRSPAWKDLLSVGEKLALWQDKLTDADRQSPATSPNRPAFPAFTPIPLPQDLASPHFGLPSTGGTVQGLARSQQPDSIPAGTMTSLSGVGSPPSFSGPANDVGRSIRIASFKLPAIGTALLNKPHVVQMLVSILRQYDVVALQGIESNRDDILPLLIDKLNQSGGTFDYLIGPRVGRVAPHEQFAFVFDTSRLETDRYQLYSVDDPEDLMNHEPLVAWFRCTGLPQSEAFTFSLINVSIDPQTADAERAMLPGLIEAVQRDGRNEDDWILLGDFAGGNAQLALLESIGARFAISDIPTNIAGTQMLDTLIFSGRSTTEFTGRAGAFDFLRKHNLSLEQAREVSEHMPVWAEFSSLEGYQPGRVAPVSGEVVK